MCRVLGMGRRVNILHTKCRTLTPEKVFCILSSVCAYFQATKLLLWKLGMVSYFGSIFVIFGEKSRSINTSDSLTNKLNNNTKNIYICGCCRPLCPSNHLIWPIQNYWNNTVILMSTLWVISGKNKLNFAVNISMFSINILETFQSVT